MSDKAFYSQMTTDELYSATESSTRGLTEQEALRRFEKFGPNEIPEKKKTGPFRMFLNQFRDFMIIILLLAAVISGYLGDMADTTIILVIVFLNSIIGFYQEQKAEKALEALKKLASSYATVNRDGQKIVVQSRNLVPGDLVYFEAGNALPADIRITESHHLMIDESTLTGESVSVQKMDKPISENEAQQGEFANIVFKGTTVSSGRGCGIVLFTGIETELGKIASLLETSEQKTPLQLRMADFSKKLSYIILTICVILFVSGWLRGENPMSMLLLSISLAVAAIPEALPALITIALARGSARMVRKKALIRKLPAVETLGSVDFICSDKTGTLTLNRMTVREISEGPKPFDEEISDILGICMALNNDAVRNEAGYLGDPTEIALCQYLDTERAEAYYKRIRDAYPRIDEIAFDAVRKTMTTIHTYQGRYLIIVKGAPETVGTMLSANQDNWDKMVHEWSDKGLRTLMFAWKCTDEKPALTDTFILEKNLIYAGIAGIADPPRPEVKTAIATCRKAGITPVMITGDHPNTAVAIARETGIWTAESRVITGPELNALDQDTFVKDVEKIAVYARVSPAQKLQIIEALQRNNHFIAMTGDGVNDAPALKKANIGIAMGISGTDVSKEAADMVLLDDHFATIVNAVEEGRRIFDNIRKFVKYIMTCNGAEIWTIMLAPLIGLPIPLLPIHILWINLVTDGLPGIALASEKAEPDVMDRPPRPARESLFSQGVGIHIVWVGLLMAGITLGTQAWAIGKGMEHWQTMVFTVLAFSQLGHVLAIRSERTFLFKQGIFTNIQLISAVLITVVLQLVVIYLPYANDMLKTQPLTLEELLICTGLSALVFHAVEFEKWIKRMRSGTENVN
jgi:Ca2+-transporting ATPase